MQPHHMVSSLCRLPCCRPLAIAVSQPSKKTNEHRPQASRKEVFIEAAECEQNQSDHDDLQSSTGERIFIETSPPGTEPRTRRLEFSQRIRRLARHRDPSVIIQTFRNGDLNFVGILKMKFLLMESQHEVGVMFKCRGEFLQVSDFTSQFIRTNMVKMVAFAQL